MATASSSSDVDGTLSMMDVLAENEELEEEATAVLGDSDDKCCTYATGYQPRQALYACDTCSADRDTMAGICLACSYACHDGHDLFELYTKRNFRCDCGNSKFPDLTCKLIQDKTPENEKNKYNQNFKGLYCYCKRPYPDPEDDVEDEMIQCIMCEDWYHGRVHKKDITVLYEVTSVKAEGAGEVDVEGEGTAQAKTISPQIKGEQTSIQSLAAECKPSSVIKSEITESSESVTDSSNHESETKDKTIRSAPSESSQECTVTESSSEVQSQQKDEKEIPGETDHSSCDGKTEENSPLREEQASTDQKLLGAGGDGSQTDGGEKIEDKKEANNSTLCQLEELKKRDVKKTEGAVFWKRGWRSKLCTCQSCKNRYEELDVSFLICEEDTVLAYEERGKVNQSGLSQYEKGIQALSNLDRTQQVEVLQGYNDMKTELRDFLQSFAQNGKVVKREDIDQFFGEMQVRKRQKTAPMQYFCR
ncbi:Protein mlo2 [Holothuria leucospilota]|uniref:Protein mlo2 n=1 Tax=Holothuria leucospilota TaxID=206669 RepID=A0A9Q1CHE3_HOLLE|nr:Protein mlo2 [Holothuria leucospilota]